MDKKELELLETYNEYAEDNTNLEDYEEENNNTIYYYRKEEITDKEVYFVDYTVNFKESTDKELINPFYVLINDDVELAFSIESNRLNIIDSSGNTDQEYILSDKDENIIDVLDKNIELLLENIRWESWTTKMKFNKMTLDSLKYAEYEHAMLHGIIDNEEFVFITFEHWYYDEMEVLYKGLCVLRNLIVEKLGEIEND